ncbi:MAG: dipeptide ABC transporter ATP-binding protein [Nitrospina sp.]|nr:dipeptide ABC transporter ATP-binding protein [Nitrospina sp.]
MTALLEIQSLKKYFPVHSGVFQKVVAQVRAVDDVSFSIKKGEILGLVGESGCGKTTLGRMTLRLIEPTGGKVLFEGQDILQFDKKAMNLIRPRMQIIFQDPYSSLNPRFTVKQILGESMLVHGQATRQDLTEKVEALMTRVGLSPEYQNRYPHEFSGGQRQRVGIARALALNPHYIVCDEPVSALDVSIQAQIINLLMELQADLNLTLLFISHDLNVVKHLSNRTAVMYLGRVVELAPTLKLNEHAAHPYTRALLAARPNLDPRQRKRNAPLPGEVPSPMNPPSGCHFHPRCPEAMGHCRTETPKMVALDEDHFVHCHLYT